MSCEGGCGCTLTDGMRETVEGIAAQEHTVERCRMIRTLREAGQAAVGPGGTAVVRDGTGPVGFAVHVTRVTRTDGIGVLALDSEARTDVQCVIAAEVAWSHSPDHLDVLGAWVKENIDHALNNPQCLPGSLMSFPLIARDPYLS